MVTEVHEREGVFPEIRTAVRHAAVYGLGNVLAKAIGFLMLPFYTHYLVPADYGLLEILDLAISLLGMVFYMGISPALLRSYAAARSAEEKKTLVSSAFLFMLATGVVIFAIGLGCVRPASLLLFGPKVPSNFLLFSFASFAVTYVTNLPRTYLRALEKSGALTIIETVCVFVMLCLNIVFIAVLKLGALAIVITPLIVGVCQAALLSGWLLRDVGIRLDIARLRGMIGFGIPLVLSNLAFYTLNFSDRFFLQHFRSLEEVGLYAVGYKFAFMISYLLIQPFNVMWQTRMYLLHAKPRQGEVFDQIFVLYSVVLTYAALALSMLSPETVRLMAGPKFQGAQAVIPVVSLAYVFCGIGFFMQTGMFLAARTKAIGLVSALMAIVNLILNYFLIGHFGMMGAAWATLISFAAIAGGNYFVSQRVFHLPLSQGRVLGGIGIGITLYFASRWLGGSGAVTLSIKGALLVSFPWLLWKLRLVSPAEIGTLASAREMLARICRPAAWAPGKAAGNG